MWRNRLTKKEGNVMTEKGMGMSRNSDNHQKLEEEE
jgi:hypothetical protein